MFLYEKDQLRKTNFYEKMTQLFLDTAAPFLKYPHTVGRSLHQFILKRLDASDSEGSTALHVAIRKEAYDIFQLLISKGTNLELLNRKGHTPLHEAAISDTEGKFLKDLLNAGAKIQTPLEYAIEAQNLKAIEILTEAERKISK